MDVLATCSEEELVQSALVKIEQDSSNFSTFVTMLRETPGLDIADVVEERIRELGELLIRFFFGCILLPACNSCPMIGMHAPKCFYVVCLSVCHTWAKFRNFRSYSYFFSVSL